MFLIPITILTVSIFLLVDYFKNECGWILNSCNSSEECFRNTCVFKTQYLEHLTSNYTEFEYNSNTTYWENSIVPFVIDSEVPLKNRKAITKGIKKFNKKTNIKIIPRTNETNYVVIVNLDGCWSIPGKLNGWQKMSISGGCDSTSVLHEFMHALGWFHEHSRPDRNDYVYINYTNIEESEKSNFETQRNFIWNDIEKYTPFDYNSLMLYNEYTFSKNSEKTIVSKKPFQKPKTFSKIDLEELEMYYINSQS